MIKQVVILLVLSLLIIFTMGYAQQGLQYLVWAHNWIDENLTQVMTGSPAIDIARKFVALLAIPIGVGLISAIVYWIAKRQWLSSFMQFIWVTWLVQTTALIMVYKVTEGMM